MLTQHAAISLFSCLHAAVLSPSYVWLRFDVTFCKLTAEKPVADVEATVHFMLSPKLVSGLEANKQQREQRGCSEVERDSYDQLEGQQEYTSAVRNPTKKRWRANKAAVRFLKLPLADALKKSECACLMSRQLVLGQRKMCTSDLKASIWSIHQAGQFLRQSSNFGLTGTTHTWKLSTRVWTTT